MPDVPAEASANHAGWLTRERMLAGALALLTLLVLDLEYEVVAPPVPALTWALALAVTKITAAPGSVKQSVP